VNAGTFLLPSVLSPFSFFTWAVAEQPAPHGRLTAIRFFRAVGHGDLSVRRANNALCSLRFVRDVHLLAVAMDFDLVLLRSKRGRGTYCSAT
jgi:hypothetical protein